MNAQRQKAGNNYSRVILALFIVGLFFLSIEKGSKGTITPTVDSKHVQKTNHDAVVPDSGARSSAISSSSDLWSREQTVRASDVARSPEDEDDDDDEEEDDDLQDDQDEDDTQMNDPFAVPLRSVPPPTMPARPKKISLSELASRIVPKTSASDDGMTEDIEGEEMEDDASNREEGANAIVDAADEEVNDNNDEKKLALQEVGETNGDKGNEEEEEELSDYKTEDSKEKEESQSAQKPLPPASKGLQPTPWEKYFNSPDCKKFRSASPGHAKERNIGQGQRSLCSRNRTEKQTVEFRTELGGSVDISIIHKAIYLPVMKAGSQMFQEVFKKRLRGRRILDREIPSYLKKFDMRIEDFFVFTFVREPLSTFVSAYGEVSKYTARNRTFVRGFSDIEDTPENEPKRALAALEDIRKGTFHGLVPAHMHTELWKVLRCLPNREATELKINFIGHLENLDHDWRYVEQLLSIPHEELPVIHSSKASPIPKRAVKFDPPSSNARFSELTKQACEYYRSDFVCFGYDDSICRK